MDLGGSESIVLYLGYVLLFADRDSNLRTYTFVLVTRYISIHALGNSEACRFRHIYALVTFPRPVQTQKFADRVVLQHGAL